MFKDIKIRFSHFKTFGKFFEQYDMLLTPTLVKLPEPLGHSQSGLPIGVQFMARFEEEGALIRLASSLEREMPWSDRIPPVHASR